jgi:1-acyl-sn-glycerol-3-phosphate acyltransferase
MKLLSSVYQGFFALIGVIGFVILLIIVTPIYFVIFLTGGTQATVAHKVSRVWARCTILVFGGRLKVVGKELLDKNETYVFVSNHLSHLDIPVCAVSTPHTFKFLAKAELGKVPLLGYIISNLYILVDRSSLRARVLSMKKMEETVAAGISVWIYPEGTRNKTNTPLGPFFDGAFQLAVATGTPMGVLTIIGTNRVLPADKIFQVNPGKVKAIWSVPIATTGMTKENIPELKNQVREAILQNIQNHG